MATTSYYTDFRLSDQWLLDSYTGKGGYLTGRYLLRHLRESDDKFSSRCKAAVYPNFARKVVDVFMGFLWGQPPSRNYTADFYNQFANNCDGAGGDLDAVLFGYQRLAMITGTVFIIVDKPQTQGLTRAEQALPYLTLRQKKQLVEETKDGEGRWLSVTFSESAQDGSEQFRQFTRTGWRLSRDQAGDEVIAQGEYTLDRVPVVRLHIAKPLEPCDSCSESFFYDLANLCWELYNLRSELREIERAQTFSILSVPAASKEERERLQDLTIGTDNGLVYDPTGGGKPEYIAPPSEPTSHFMARMDALMAEIYKIANLEFVGGVQQSGVALAFHFREANSSLRGMAGLAEAAEREIADIAHLWQGQQTSGDVYYANDFNLTDLAGAIAQALELSALGLGVTFDAVLKKRLARQVLGNDAPPETLAEIDQEIDAQGDAYGDRIAQQAQDQPPGGLDNE